MSVVNALQFDPKRGAILSDEEYWHRRRRRTLFSDHLYKIVPEEVSEKTGLEAVLGGAGSPTFFVEVADEVRKRLTACLEESGEQDPTGLPSTVKQLNAVVLKEVHKAFKRRVENVLRLYFGFGTDDLNQGSFKWDGESIDIVQDLVKKEAKDVAAGKGKVAFINDLMEARGVLLGCDRSKGFSCFYVNPKEGVISHTSGGFESVGSGKYAAGISFAEFLNKRLLKERREGYDRVDGMVALIRSGLAARRYFSEVGGAFHIIYLDANGDSHSGRFLEVPYEAGVLASEIVAVMETGAIDWEKGSGLVESLIYGDADVESAEKALFAAVPDQQRLRLYLEGYKLDNLEVQGKRPIRFVGEEA